MWFVRCLKTTNNYFYSIHYCLLKYSKNVVNIEFLFHFYINKLIFYNQKTLTQFINQLSATMNFLFLVTNYFIIVKISISTYSF